MTRARYRPALRMTRRRHALGGKNRSPDRSGLRLTVGGNPLGCYPWRESVSPVLQRQARHDDCPRGRHPRVVHGPYRRQVRGDLRDLRNRNRARLCGFVRVLTLLLPSPEGRGGQGVRTTPEREITEVSSETNKMSAARLNG